MTNMEVFEFGKNLGSFNYMDGDSLDENNLGYLIEFDNMVYQIIVNQNNVLLDPEGEAIPFAPSLDHVRNTLKQKSKEPLKVETRIVDAEYFDNLDEFHRINREVVNEHIQNGIMTNTLFNENGIDEFNDNLYTETNMPDIEMPKRNENGESGTITHNLIDFNRPW